MMANDFTKMILAFSGSQSQNVTQLSKYINLKLDSFIIIVLPFVVHKQLKTYLKMLKKIKNSLYCSQHHY